MSPAAYVAFAARKDLLDADVCVHVTAFCHKLLAKNFAETAAATRVAPYS